MSDVFGHPWLGGHFGDPAVAARLAPPAQLAAMIAVEAAYARARGSEDAARAIEAAPVDIAALREGCARDGLPVPALVRELKRAVPEDLHGAVHAGLTSQDVIDTALILTLRDVLDVFEARLTALEAALKALSARHGARVLTGRTRMQAAVPITVADRIAPWAAPLADHRARLSEMRPRLLRLSFGGAAGTRAASGADGPALAAAMAETLGLGNPPKAWHAMRDSLGEYAAWLSLVTGTLGKAGQDIALMAQQGLGEITVAGCGGSSAMPHKQNPVLAELLVTLARFNAAQLGGFHQALVHEQERSGVAWTLEWMLLPPMTLATGRALSTALTLVPLIERMGDP